MTPRDKGPSGLVVAGRDVDSVLSIKIENILDLMKIFSIWCLLCIWWSNLSVNPRKHFFFKYLRYLVSSRKKSFKKHWKKGGKWLLRCKYFIFKYNLPSYLVNTTSQYSEKKMMCLIQYFEGRIRLPHLEKPCSLLLRWGKQHFFWFLSPIGIFFCTLHYLFLATLSNWCGDWRK